MPSGTKIKYQAHNANIGWQNWVYDGSLAGVDGQGNNLEAIKIELEGAPEGYSIEYRAHVANVGWNGYYGSNFTSNK